MIELKRCNYITGDKNSVSYGVSRIIDFFEVAGKTPLLFHNPNNSDLKYFVKTSRMEFNSISEFSQLVGENSNLFRVDLLVLDVWYLNQIQSIIDYKKILEKIGIDFIIISKKCYYKTSDDVKVYQISRCRDDEHLFKPQTNYQITEKIANWTSTLDDLVLSYRRDKKIDDIIDGDIC